MKSLFAAALVLAAPVAAAEVTASGPDHYVLKHEAVSDLAPEALWKKLIRPETWWHPDHTYSGDAANLELDAAAGGLWREVWEGGSVSHGQVLLAKPGEQLRLDAPFGPLQEMGVAVVWTITLSAEGAGTKVVFDEVASGSSASGLDAIAPAVDFVKSEAIARLTASPE
ncbi:MAG: SRPBCC domain-containing protein [Pseudomonadota bacterium]